MTEKMNVGVTKKQACSDIELEVQKGIEKEREEREKLEARYCLGFEDGYLTGLQDGFSEGYNARMNDEVREGFWTGK